MATDFGDYREFENGESMDDAGVDAAWYTNLKGFVGLGFASEVDLLAGSGESRHAISRVFALVNCAAPDADTATFLVDDRNDWRGRMFTLVGVRAAANVPPGSSEDGSLSAINRTIGYTGPGEAAGQASCPPYGKTISTTGWWIYADDETGALKVDVPTGASTTLLSGILRIVAGPRLGEAIAVTDGVEMPSPADADSIVPIHLNKIQDAAVMTQALADDAGTLPLGPECRGDVPIPVEWEVRGEVVRQNIAGQARRFFTVALGLDETRTIDNSIDWRDRLVTMTYLRLGSINDLPGESNDADCGNVDADNHIMFSLYTGSGFVGTGTDYLFEGADGLRVYADPDDGSLVLEDAAGLAVSAVAMLDATPQIGPRTVNR